MKYFYVTKSRPFNADVYLKKGFVRASMNRDIDGCNYYDLLIYNKKLKDEEVRDLELEYLGEYGDI